MHIISTFKSVIFRKYILFLLLGLFCQVSYGQIASNKRTKQLSLSNDTIQLDTLSIVLGSIKLATADGNLLDTAFCKINYAEGKIIVNRKKLSENNPGITSIISSYQTFPYLFSETTKHKDINRIKPDLFGNANPFSYNIESKNDDIFKMDGLNKSGSISR